MSQIVDGQYLIIPKHKHRKTGVKRRLQRRQFHGIEEMQTMENLAQKYAAENSEDYLIVQVVKEVSKPKES